MINNVEQFGYALWLARLDELSKATRKELMPFPDVRLKLCRDFRINKQICMRFLHKLWQEGYIESSPCHGVKLSKIGKALLQYLDNLKSESS